MAYLNLFLILFVCVCVTDKFNFWGNMATEIRRLIVGTEKPVKLPYILNCSLCQTFWLGLIYLICTANITILNIAVLVGISACNQLLYQTINLIESLILSIFNKISDKLS